MSDDGHMTTNTTTLRNAIRRFAAEWLAPTDALEWSPTELALRTVPGALGTRG